MLVTATAAAHFSSAHRQLVRPAPVSQAVSKAGQQTGCLSGHCQQLSTRQAPQAVSKAGLQTGCLSGQPQQPSTEQASQAVSKAGAHSRSSWRRTLGAGTRWPCAPAVRASQDWPSLSDAKSKAVRECESVREATERESTREGGGGGGGGGESETHLARLHLASYRPAGSTARGTGTPNT